MYIRVGTARPTNRTEILGLVALSIIIIKVHLYSYLYVYMKAIWLIDSINIPYSSLAIIVAKFKHDSCLSAENNEYKT